MYELVIITGPMAGTVLPVTHGMVAGRSDTCPLKVPDPNASREHCRFAFDGASLTVYDNGSSNGTWVNDQRIAAVVLKPGDVVRLGETRMRIQAAARKPKQAEDPSASSIFQFREADSDLSQSVVLPVDPSKGSGRNAEARLTAIIKASRALADIGQLDTVLGSLIDCLFDVFGQAERCFIMLGDTVETLQPRAIRLRGQPSGGDLPAVSRSICRKALQGRSAVLFNEGAGDQEVGMSIVSLRIRSAMTVPLILDEIILGLIQLDTSDRGRAFTADDLEVAVAFGRMAALAVNNARMLADIEEKTKARDNLARFAPGAVAELVLQGKMDFGLGGKTYVGTMMFSDVIGFTRMSEHLGPEAVVAMMNDYFEHVVPCIHQEDGAIDKFIGDAIFAYWGFPLDKGDAPAKAAAAALAMQRVMHVLNARRGGDPLAHGIGLHTGTVVWGNIGTAASKNATALGDAVNTASRIEHAALAGQVLVSQDTWSAMGPRAFGLRMPPLQARNKAEPLTVHSLRGLAQGEEISLHLPATCGEAQLVLIRRHSDRTFTCLMPAGCDIVAEDLVLRLPEMPPATIGRASAPTVLGSLEADGPLRRCQFTLADPSLGGLLSGEPQACPYPWERMVR
jgi:adenylate cyclase